MEIVNIKTKDIIPYENNPRVNDNAVTPVANSIKQFGFKVPVIIDKDNVIIAGHTRLKAALKLGLEEIPCVYADGLTDEQARALRLADNKVGEYSGWDFEKLEAELNALAGKLGGALNLKDFGFDTDADLDIAAVPENEIEDMIGNNDESAHCVQCPRCKRTFDPKETEV